MKISLCLMTWNELEGCKLDVPRLPREMFDEIYAIDGGSTDGTVEYLHSQNITVYLQPKTGINAAYVHANNVSHCDAVVVFFPKGNIPPEDTLRFRLLFDQGYELVIASRQIPGALHRENRGLWRPRKWCVFWLSVLARMLWRREGYWVRDVLHGFKGWTRDAFSRMNIQDHDLSIDIEMVVRSYKLRLKRAEFPTKEAPRPFGHTHFKMWPTGKKLLTYLMFELRRRV